MHGFGTPHHDDALLPFKYPRHDLTGRSGHLRAPGTPRRLMTGMGGEPSMLTVLGPYCQKCHDGNGKLVLFASLLNNVAGNPTSKN